MRNGKSIATIGFFSACIVSCLSTGTLISGSTLTPTYASAPTSTVAPSRTVKTSPTGTPSPTPTEVILPTATNTATPAPGLTTAGPYLFIGDTAYELDGSGRRELALPTNNPDFQENYSPDRRWFAYVTGQDYGFPTAHKDEMTLRIRDLWTGNEKEVAKLAPEDYQARLEKLAEELNQEMSPPSYDDYVPDCEIAWYNLDLDMYLWYSWSPDGRYLAFSAMIDGNSSDVYLYDTDTGTIQRKDDDELNVRYIGWSPDGRWIRYYNYVVGDSSCYSYDRNPTPDRYVRADSSNTDFSINLNLVDWTFPQEWLMSEIRFRVGQSVSIDGWPGYQSLYLANSETGARTKVWANGWSGFAVDPGRREIAILGYQPCEGEDCWPENTRLFIGPLTGSKKRTADLEGIQYKIIFRHGAVHRYLIATAISYYPPVYSDIRGLNQAGTLDPIKTGGNYRISFSPDYRWMAIAGGDGITLLDPSDQIYYSWADKPVGDIAWKTNSQALYFSTSETVYYLPIEEPMPQPVFQCGKSSCWGLSLNPSIHLSALPSLRARPTPIDDPAQGTSIWYKTTYKDLDQPGIQEYTVSLPFDHSGRWGFSWCAKTQQKLTELLAPLEIEFLIGGERIGEDVFRIYDVPAGGGYCRNWATLLSGWRPGDAADLEILYTLGEAVNDGTRVYPAGEYRQIIHVTVTG
jgi:hypothetical protein